jgi:hypothetical protein
MKLIALMTKKNLIVIIFLTVFILLSGCKKEKLLEPQLIDSKSSTDVVANPDLQNLSSCSPECEQTVTLKAGQHTSVGTLYYKNTYTGTVDFTYSVNAPWKITSVSLYIGDCSQIPRNHSGNTMPGQYPYKQTLPNGGVLSTIIQVSRQSVPICGCIAAHATVYNTTTGATETAWANGTRFTNTNWAMYFPYCLATCNRDCGYPAWYWFGDITMVWPQNNITIGNQTYTKAECYSIIQADPLEYFNIPDAKKCFIQICSFRLSQNSISPQLPIWNDLVICENYLNSLGQKLSPTFLPTGNENALAAAERIELWLKANPCIGK